MILWTLHHKGCTCDMKRFRIQHLDDIDELYSACFHAAIVDFIVFSSSNSCLLAPAHQTRAHEKGFNRCRGGTNQPPFNCFLHIHTSVACISADRHKAVTLVHSSLLQACSHHWWHPEIALHNLLFLASLHLVPLPFLETSPWFSRDEPMSPGAFYLSMANWIMTTPAPLRLWPYKLFLLLTTPRFQQRKCRYCTSKKTPNAPGGDRTHVRSTLMVSVSCTIG